MSRSSHEGSDYAAGLPDKVTVPLGAEVRVPLRSAAGAGYVWQVICPAQDREVAAATIELENPPLQKHPPSNLPSAATLVILGRKIGKASCKLRLVRPWSLATPLVEKDMELEVTR